MLIVCILVGGVTVSLSIALQSQALLVYDTGSYDAGIATSYLSTGAQDKDSYSVLFVLLVHETLVLSVVPCGLVHAIPGE